MSAELSFQLEDLYNNQRPNRVLNNTIRNGSIYTAFSKLQALYSPHEALAFPVRLEAVPLFTDPQRRKPMARLAVNMVLLDEDFQPKKTHPLQALIEDGMWKVKQPIPVDEVGTKPIDNGYFLLSMPNDILLSQLDTYRSPE